MISEIRQIVSEREFREDIIDFLLDICRVDTTAGSDIRLMAENEKKVFDRLKDKLGELSFENATIMEKKISSSISKLP